VSRAKGDAATIGTSRLIEAVDGRRYAFADHNCFACGGTNPIGMHLAIELGEGTASTTWLPGANYVGWEEKVHGGLLASFDSWAVTAEISVRYRSPANPGEPLTARGWVTERRRRIYSVRGEVRGADGRLVAEGHGRFLGASPSVKAELKARYGLPTDVTTAGARRE
jgi:acyl-coenzyme A thioesterase PaaI-like protein